MQCTQLKHSLCLPMYCRMDDEKDIAACIKTAAETGFEAVEIWSRHDVPFEMICSAAADNGLALACMGGQGGPNQGLNRRETHDAMLDELKASIEVAAAKGIPSIICFSGNRHGASDAECAEIIAEALLKIKSLAEQAAVTVILEVLNSRRDHPGYQCDHTVRAVSVIDAVDSPNVKILYDVYHMQIMEGDLCRTIEANIDRIGHFHVAGNPGRMDPDDEQEINYRAVSRTIAQSGYKGYLGHEWKPKGSLRQALKNALKHFSA